jgi:hypothetical protein
MSALDRIALGAPGVYTLAPEPIRRLTGVRLDGCAFVGVAPRGPCRVPIIDNTPAGSDDWQQCDPARARVRSMAVQVNSFDAYRRLFGGYEGPGLLPYAVATYFEQGGRVAWVVRIVHDFGNAALDAGGVAQGTITGVLGSPALAARNEGAWGNGIVASLSFSTRALLATAVPPSTTALRLGSGQRLPPGTLLRLRLADGSFVLRFVTALADQADALQPRHWTLATLETPTASAIVGAEIVEAAFTVADAEGRGESYSGLGLHVAHPQWLATVLCRQSQLVWPDIAWAGDRLTPADPLRLLGDFAATRFAGGEDRYVPITPEDFFDPGWDPREEEPAAGLPSVLTAAGHTDITQIVLPDLYQPLPLPLQSQVGDVSLAGPDFAPCVEVPTPDPTPPNAIALPGLALDPADPADLAQITALLLRVQDFVETTQDHIALLDVPPGLKPAQVAAFRSHFDSSYCALYHPWLRVATGDDARDALVSVPPSAAAAGIVAARELAHGVPFGPANEVVAQAVQPLQTISPAEHDLLHPLGINVYLQEPAGVRLTAARTLSLDAQWRQLSVRRLLLLLRRTLLQQMQWAVFEPNTPALRRQIVHLLTAFLRRLYRLGAFTGATEAEAFFVQCDDSLNPLYRIDNGQLLAHIGVAPAEPLEFIVLQLSRSGDGTLALEDA